MYTENKKSGETKHTGRIKSFYINRKLLNLLKNKADEESRSESGQLNYILKQYFTPEGST